MTIDQLLSTGAKSAFTKDSPLGHVVSGPIIDARERQSTDFATKAPEFWDDGSPKMQIVVTIQTDQRVDSDDDGARSIYIKSWGLDKIALVQAIHNGGFSKASEGLAAGNVFTAKFASTQPSKFGSDQKIYEYWVQRGAQIPSVTTPPVTPAPVYPWTVGQPAPAPAPVPVQVPQQPADVRAAIQAGWDNTSISAAFGAAPEVIAAVRQQLGA